MLFRSTSRGCPVPKVVNNGEGSALLKNPLLVGKIVEAMANAVDKPVTVKIRTGFDETCINAEEIAYIIQESGGAAVAVHGRTRSQYYSGKADWDVIILLYFYYYTIPPWHSPSLYTKVHSPVPCIKDEMAGLSLLPSVLMRHLF